MQNYSMYALNSSIVVDSDLYLKLEIACAFYITSFYSLIFDVSSLDAYYALKSLHH